MQGIMILVMACLFLSNDHLVINHSDGQKEVVTRQDHPLIYWGIGSGLLAGAFVSFTISFFLRRIK